MHDILEVAFASDPPADTGFDGAVFLEGDQALDGRTPSEAICDIAASQHFNSHDVRGAWIIRVDADGGRWVPVMWGELAQTVVTLRRPESVNLGGPGRDYWNPFGDD